MFDFDKVVVLSVNSIVVDWKISCRINLFFLCFVFFCFVGCMVCKVGLMFLVLGVSEIGVVILVDCKVEVIFEGVNVVVEEVRVFVEIDGFEGEFV